MSKPALRIVLSVLISLGVILAIAATVPGMGINAESNNAKASLFASANDHASVAGRVSLSARTGTFSTSTQFESMNQRSGHECGSFSDPNVDD